MSLDTGNIQHDKTDGQDWGGVSVLIDTGNIQLYMKLMARTVESDECNYLNGHKSFLITIVSG